MMPGKRRFDMLFPVDNEARQIKELNGIWNLREITIINRDLKKNGLKNHWKM